MKLPTVQHIKRITKMNSMGKRYSNKGKKLNLLNYLLLPNNNISSILYEKNNKISSDFRNSKQYINNINNIKQKNHTANTSKTLFFPNQNNYINSFKNRKNTINVKYKKNEEEKDKYTNYAKYIKNTLNSYKIKKEISSYLYSTPEKQIRIINYLSSKLNKLSPNKKINSNKVRKESHKIRKIKVMKRFIKSEYNFEYDDKKDKDKDKEKDEDKINLKEYTFFPLFTKDKNIPCKKIKYLRNKDRNYIESWDNNLLKNILPQNLKCHYGLESYERNMPKKGLTTLNLNTVNNKESITKYTSENNHNNIDKNNIKNYK